MRGPSPSGLPIEPLHIPGALKAMRRWVAWVNVPVTDKAGNTKTTKQPRQAGDTRYGASVNKAQHWNDFDVAIDAVSVHGCPGIGLVMTDLHQSATPLVGIDIDHCLHPDGAPNETARSILELLPTAYWEVSPSGEGLRGFCFGKISHSFLNAEAGVEFYNGDSPRYLTVTGDRLPAYGEEINYADESSLERAHALFITEGRAGSAVREDLPEVPVLDDGGRSILEAVQGRPADFARCGDTSAYDDDRSRAVMALATSLSAMGLPDGEALSALQGHAVCWQTALDHREGAEDRALQYLWATYTKARLRAGPAVPDEFLDLSDCGGPADLAHRQREADSAGETDAAGPSDPAGDTELTPRLPTFTAASLQGLTPAPREWVVDQWIPRGTVTLLYGEGGVGKSLAIQELLWCVAMGTPWFGLPVRAGRALGVFCEDDKDELHRRLLAICAKQFYEPEDAADRLHLLSRVGLDNLLMTFDRGVGTKTQLYQDIGVTTQQIRADLLVLDTAADLFGGNEIDRLEVRTFMGALANLAIKCNCAVVLCAHPSASGAKAGTSGSTAWNASARSRLLLSREAPASNVRTLETMKANYAAVGKAVRLAWLEGAFYTEEDRGGEAFFHSREEQVEQLIVDCMRTCMIGNRVVSASPNTRDSRYLPKVALALLKHSGKAVKIEELTEVMNLMLAHGRLVEVESARKNGGLELALPREPDAP